MYDKEEIFTDIYKRNAWKGRESVSGKGSDLEQTETLRRELPKLIKRLGIKSMLDFPCGDCNWIMQMDMTGLEDFEYIGADIVKELIEQNIQKTYGHWFHHASILSPFNIPGELILCRDCLVHFSNGDVFKALKNICATDSKYLLTTNFMRGCDNLPNIQTGKGWRPLNLCLAPFNLPVPEFVLNEHCPVFGFEDKVLYLWKIENIRKALK